MHELDINSSDEEDTDSGNEGLPRLNGSSFKLHFFITIVIQKDLIDKYLRGIESECQFEDIALEIC
jgi:hypothetical protein